MIDKKAKIEELVRDAEEHYERLATESGEWNSLVPKALKYYKNQKKEEI